MSISVNGMANEDGDDFANRVNEILNANAKPFHNPSNLAIPYVGGPGLGDLIQSLAYEASLHDTASVGLAELIRDAHAKMKSNGCEKICIKIYAHSQGTMLTRKAFDFLRYAFSQNDESLASVMFCGYGGETVIQADEYGLRGAENHINAGDFLRFLPAQLTNPREVAPGGGGHPFVNYIY